MKVLQYDECLRFEDEMKKRNGLCFFSKLYYIVKLQAFFPSRGEIVKQQDIKANIVKKAEDCILYETQKL